MFCPKCSQVQSTDNIHYCSRCGFQLTTVAVLLENDGVLPQSALVLPGKTLRSRMATESFILTVFSWAMGLFMTFWFDAGGRFEIIAKIGAVIFFSLGLIGLLRFLYAFLFVKDHIVTEALPSKSNNVIRGNPPQALPHPQQPSISDWSRRVNTREMASPSSVTENTTRLLDED
jgi:hypothetical protein